MLSHKILIVNVIPCYETYTFKEPTVLYFILILLTPLFKVGRTSVCSHCVGKTEAQRGHGFAQGYRSGARMQITAISRALSVTCTYCADYLPRAHGVAMQQKRQMGYSVQALADL